MTLASWQAKSWIHQHHAPKQEVLGLLHEAESDLGDARRDILPAWSFSLACTSALTLCNVLLHTSGYRLDENHPDVASVLPMILGEDHAADAGFLKNCLQIRAQMNIKESYEVTSQQASEIIHFTEDLYQKVVDWLRSWDSAMVVNGEMSLSRESDWILSLVDA